MRNRLIFLVIGMVIGYYAGLVYNPEPLWSIVLFFISLFCFYRAVKLYR